MREKAYKERQVADLGMERLPQHSWNSASLGHLLHLHLMLNILELLPVRIIAYFKVSFYIVQNTFTLFDLMSKVSLVWPYLKLQLVYKDPETLNR